MDRKWIGGNGELQYCLGRQHVNRQKDELTRILVISFLLW
jgi:hypothetical protein